MGKRKKEHRKRVAARNQRIKQAETAFKNKFQEEFLKQLELEKQRIVENKKSSEVNSEGAES